MVGDNAELDIGGGAAACLRTAWTANGREWPDGLDFHPTVLAADCPSALRALIRQ